ncbi:MAG: Type II secretory pathway, component PulF [Glomeribacter sp. 1016415]|nr:Type II secretory pathway, component PulF [Glomeribacter sp. 1016415]
MHPSPGAKLKQLWQFMHNLCRTRGTRRLAWAQRRFRKKRAEFYNDLASQIDSQPGQTLAIFLQKYALRYPGEPVGIVCAHWLARFAETARFSRAVAHTLPPEETTVLAVAEESGDLKIGLRTLAANIETLEATQRLFLEIITSALVGLAIAHIFLGLIGYWIVPQIETAMNLETRFYGPIAQTYHGFATVIRSVGPAWLALLLAGLLWGSWSIKNYTGRFRGWLDQHILFYALYRDFAGALFLATLSSITQKIGAHAISIHEALARIKPYASTWLAQHIERISRNFEEIPNSGGEAFATGILKREFQYRLQDLSEYQKLECALFNVSQHILRETPNRIKRTATLIRYSVSFLTAAGMMGLYFGLLGMIHEFQASATLQHIMQSP